MAIEFHRDGPWDLPEGWVWAKLGAFLKGHGETVEPRKCPRKRFVLYSVPSFDTGQPEIVTGSEVGSSKQRVARDDVLLCKINPRINRSWIVGSHPGDDVIASTEWIVLNGKGAITPAYLQWILRQERVRAYLASNVNGVGGSLMRVKPTTIADIPVPIPPLAEQTRIVARIDELFTEIADGEAELTHARTNLDTWRRALLKAAVTGQLTASWRVENEPDETGEELVRRIKSEKMGRKRILRTKDAEEDQEDLLEGVPASWASATFGELFDLYTGSTPSRSNRNYWGGSIPWVSSGEVAFWCARRSWRDPAGVSPAQVRSSARLVVSVA
jgi:type I restriction enzyme, S subunit